MSLPTAGHRRPVGPVEEEEPLDRSRTRLGCAGTRESPLLCEERTDEFACGIPFRVVGGGLS